MKLLRKEILKYYSGLSKKLITEDIQKVIKFIKYFGISYIPYIYVFNFDPKDVIVHYDKNRNLNFVYYKGKKLFFNTSMTIDEIKKYYTSITIEQEIDSPHRYLDSDFNVSENDIVIDIGAAEGNFSLSIIEKVKKLYIIESDEKWIEALIETFAPWKDKVTIINKFISNKQTELLDSLDSIFLKNEKINFIKLDVEGEEINVLNGAQNLLSKFNPKLAVCTYHNQEDADNISKYLAESGYGISFTKGYMLPVWAKLKPPYLRKGVLRAKKLT